MGAGGVSKQTTLTAEEMAESVEDVASVGYGIAYGWRIGPAPRSPWYMGARLEGYAATESDVSGGYLTGGGNLGVQLVGVIVELGLGFGVLGSGSFNGAPTGGAVTPAVSTAFNIGFPIGQRLRLYLLRGSFAVPVVADRTELGLGYFIGPGAEWTPPED